jgi:type IV pilus assembly protein PilV
MRLTRIAVHQKLKGVSLIEVLVSIVIASVGLLALAGVNASSIRYTKMSQYRGTATQLASDMAERMRANKAGLAAYDIQTSFADQATLPNMVATECNSTATACTAAQVAAYDLVTWRFTVRDQLPEGSIYIAYQNVQTAADVWVVWRDPAVADDDLSVAASECPGTLGVGADPSVRCSYFRINL